MKKHPPIDRQQILQSYEHHLREVAGLAPKTCRNHAPATLRLMAGSIRQFLNFAQQQGWTSQPLSLAIPKIACRTHHDLPVYLNQEQLGLLLGSWDLSTSEGKRDLAIGLCLARLGMRAGEVAALKLEDLKWRQGILRLNQSKNGNPAELPLLTEVGESIANYLRGGRPASSYRQVFLLHRRVRPMNPEAISYVIKRALRGCDIKVPRPAPFAVRTLLTWYRSGAPVGPKLWTLSTYLGHRHLAHTYWYLTAVPELMQLCQERFATAQIWASEGGAHV